MLRHVPALLARLSLFLRSQDDYRRSVSLMSAASCSGTSSHAYDEHHKSIIEYAARLARERTFILFKEG